MFIIFFGIDESDSRKVIVKKLVLLTEGREDMELNLTGDLNEIKKEVHSFIKHIYYY